MVRKIQISETWKPLPTSSVMNYSVDNDTTANIAKRSQLLNICHVCVCLKFSLKLVT